MKELKHNLPTPKIYATECAIDEIQDGMAASKAEGLPIVCMALLAVREDSLKIVEFSNFDRITFAKILWAVQNDIPGLQPISDSQLREWKMFE